MAKVLGRWRKNIPSFDIGGNNFERAMMIAMSVYINKSNKIRQQMRCVTGNQAQFVCISKECEMRNAYICANPEDGCKVNHEACSLISLSFLLKKTRSESSSKSSENKFSKLVPMYEKVKAIASSINKALLSAKSVKDINQMLEDGGPLSSEDKDKITQFMETSKSNHPDNSPNLQLQKQLDEFLTIALDYQSSVKQTRNRQIEDLKRRMERQDKMRETQMPLPTQSRMTEKHQVKMSALQPESRVQNFKIKQQEKNRETKSAFSSNGPSPVKGKTSELKSKTKKGFGFEQKLEAALKNHLPKAPLFSNITNDITTINNLFHEKFQKANLLYRASQHNYLVNKFHEKCDGHKNTLVLILTQFDRIIGGFTPLAWKSGGGDYYEDKNCESFLFNLSSGEKYPLIEKQKAIWCSRTFGPSFGNPDLEIADKSFHNSNSCANFPLSYNNGNYINSPGSTQLFCGTKSGHFRIKQWEVYELIFP